MNLNEYRESLHAACAELFATPIPESVANAQRRIAALVADEPEAQSLQYRILRDLVEEASRGEHKSHYTLLIALHDSLLRGAAFSPPGESVDYLLFFDEAFYLDAHEDIAAAIRAGDRKSVV